MPIFQQFRELMLMQLNINVQENSQFSSRLVVATGTAVASHPYVRVRLLFHSCMQLPEPLFAPIIYIMLIFFPVFLINHLNSIFAPFTFICYWFTRIHCYHLFVKNVLKIGLNRIFSEDCQVFISRENSALCEKWRGSVFKMADEGPMLMILLWT